MCEMASPATDLHDMVSPPTLLLEPPSLRLILQQQHPTICCTGNAAENSSEEGYKNTAGDHCADGEKRQPFH